MFIFPHRGRIIGNDLKASHLLSPSVKNKSKKVTAFWHFDYLVICSSLIEKYLVPCAFQKYGGKSVHAGEKGEENEFEFKLSYEW